MSVAKAPPTAEETARAAPRSTMGELALRKDMPLVPISSIAGRALVTVIAIMTFLGSLTAGSAVLIGSASRDWRHAVAREMTIQVRPITGRDIEGEVAKAAALARGAPGVESVAVFDRAEGERLLEPWLGSGLDLADLPIPRLIVVKLSADGRFDAGLMKRSLAESVAGASLDDHRLWIERLATMADTMVAVAVVIFRARAGGDGPRRRFRDARRDGRQPGDRRRAALRRRGGPLHRQGVPAPLPAPRPARGRHRRGCGHGGLRRRGAARNAGLR